MRLLVFDRSATFAFVWFPWQPVNLVDAKCLCKVATRYAFVRARAVVCTCAFFRDMCGRLASFSSVMILE